MMQFIQIKEFGSADQLQLASSDIPSPQDGEVLIKVVASGLNRADILQRKGHYPPPSGASDIPGLEVSGIIEKSNSPLWSKGDRVCALLAGGGYAQYCTVDARLCLPVPGHISTQDAAAFPEALFTVWNNIFDIGQFKQGQTILVHGGSSGIGTAAIQMVKALGGAIYVTAGSAAKCNACIKLGADLAINYKESDFAEEIRRYADSRKIDQGVDIILDMVGGDYIAKNLPLLREFGRHISIASPNGRMAEIDIAQMMIKKLTITGSTLRARPLPEKVKLAGALREHIWPLVEDKTIHPVIYKTLPYQDVSAAHELMETGQHIGKILLSWA